LPNGLTSSAAGRQAKGIKVLHRRVLTESARKVVVIVQAEEGAIAQHIGEALPSSRLKEHAWKTLRPRLSWTAESAN